MSKTVLLVDDDALFRAAISDGLRAAGYAVAVATDGLEALERVREAPPDCILLDLILPKLDGVRTFQLLKGHPEHRGIPVIIVTGLGQGLANLDELKAEAVIPKRQTGATLGEILKTLQLIESGRRPPPRTPAEAAGGLAERRIVTELLAERRHLQVLLAALGEGVVELDEGGRIIAINPAGLRLLDRPEDAILGGLGAGLLGAANAPALQRGLAEVQAGGDTHTAPLDLPYGTRTIRVTLTAVPGPEGRGGALLILRDLTDLATRRARSFAALAAVGEQILSKLDLAAVFREIVTRTAELLGAERCGLFRIEPDAGQLRLRCVQAVGLSERYARDLYLAPGEAVVGKALAERRTVHSSDLLQDPAIHLSPSLRSLVQEEGIGAVLAAPILLSDGAFGALTVYQAAGRPFTEEEVELVTSLAGAAAMAIENARLFSAMRQQEEHLRALLETNKKIGTLVPMDVLLASIAEEAARVLQVDAAGFRLVEGDHLVLAGVTDGAREVMRTQRLRRDESLSGWVVTHGRPLVVADVVQDPRLIEAHREAARRLGHRAFLGVPLKVGERVTGVLTFRAKGARKFTEEDVQLGAAFADQAAIAVENARLYHSAKQAGQEIAALYEGAQAITESLDLETALLRIGESARGLAGSDRAFVWLVDPQDGSLRAGIAVGPGAEAFLGTRMAAESPATAARAVREGRPLVVSDARDPARADPALSAQFGNSALLAVPLRVRDTVPGVLVCGYDEPRSFAAGEVDRVARLAQQAAVAIQNAQLYAQTREALDELSVLHQAGQAIAQSLDLAETLQHIVDAAMRLTQMDKGIIWLLDEERQELAGTVVMGLPGDLMVRMPLAEPSLVATCLREGRVLISESPDADPRVNRAVQARFRNRALIAVPLRSGPRTIGILDLGDMKRPRHFTTREIAILERLAQQAVVAIENARLYEDVRGRAREATALAEVGRTLSGSLDLDRVLELIVQGVLRVMGAPFAGIMTLDAERQELTYAKAAGLDIEHLRNVRLRVGEGIAGRAVEAGGPVQSAKLAEDPRYVGPGLAETEALRSLLCVPLVAGGRPLGALTVFRREEGDFPPGEVQLLTRFADHAALAIESARLYAEIRKAYADLQAAQEQLVQIEKFRALGVMAGGVAHDFNNLLAAILGRAQLLKLRADDPELRRGLALIEQVALDGAHTVRRILGFARVHPEVHSAPVDLHRLLEQTLEVTRPRWQDEAQGRGAPIEAILALEPVPPVWGDAAELQEALVNLVFNAVDAMPQGGCLSIGARRLRPAARAGAGRKPSPGSPAGGAEGTGTQELVEVFVQDTGTGMTAEVSARAFEPFFTTKGSEGSGLGLAMVYGIASRHGGEVRLDSRQGVGTTVSLRFPATARPATDAKGEALPAGIRASRIMVVDDNGRVGDVLAELLRSRGHEVRAFTDPRAALVHLAQEPVDVLFTDLGMPEISGWDVSREARSLRPDLPVVLVTGWGDQVDPGQVVSHHVSAVLKKPFRAEDILRVLAELRPVPQG